MKQVFATRREALRRLMKRENLGGLLVQHPANRYYLSGFELQDGQCNESSGCILILPDGKDWLCTDSRFHGAANELWDSSRILIYRGSAVEDIRKLALDKVQGELGFESKIMSCAYHEKFAPGLRLACGDGLVEELRVIKDEAEISLMRASAKLNHALMEVLPQWLVPGENEASIAWRIERFFREHGASENSFIPIVAKNAHAALPHYHAESPETAETITDNCHVLVDVGARLNHYCSDQTRTFWVGEHAEPRFTEMLRQVRQAQQAAIAGMRAGVTGKQIHELAVKSFAAEGVESYFTHSLGHGVGLETHEEPRLNFASATVLQAGMVVTVEPGLYYPSWGGARWEYMVLVTEEGCEIL